MAQFEVEGIDDLMKELSSLDAEKLAPVMLEEAVPILKDAVRLPIRTPEQWSIP